MSVLNSTSPAWIMALMLGALSFFGPATATGQPAAQHKDSAAQTVYEVTIGGRTVDVVESRPVKVRLPDGREVEVSVARKRLQPYAAGRLKFDYDANMSLKDDAAREQRQVVLLHANGSSVVITDLDKPVADQKASLAQVVKAMRQRFEQGKIKDMQETPAEAVKLPRAEGVKSVLTYTDDDGQVRVCEMYTLTGGPSSFHVIRQYKRTLANDAMKVTDPTLRSIRTE